MLIYANFYHGSKVEKIEFNFVDVTFSPTLTRFFCFICFYFFNDIKNEYQIK